MKTHALTVSPKGTELTHVWHMRDAAGQTLGRFATEVAALLMGKNKPSYVANLDCGDFVVVVNAEKIKVTGKKVTDKTYYRHSQMPGGFKAESFQELMDRKPTEAIIHAVRGMLPKNKLRAKMLKRLRVVAGAENPFADKFAQTKKASE